MVLNSEIPQKLGTLGPGARGEIVGFCIEDDRQGFLHRLYEIGFLVGETIEILQEAPVSKDPISVRIKDATYALRRQDANLIQVRKVPS